MYDCIVGAGGAGRLLGTSDGNCARISEEREDSIRPVSASSGAGARLLPSAARDPRTGHHHSYEHRGPGQAEVPRLGVNSSAVSNTINYKRNKHCSILSVISFVCLLIDSYVRRL